VETGGGRIMRVCLTTLALCALCVLPYSAEGAEAKKPYRGRLLEISGDEDDPVRVWGLNGKQVLAPYQLQRRGLALLDGEYSLRLEGGSYFSEGAEEHLGGGLRAGKDQLSLSVYVYPATFSQEGSGCIAGYAPKGGKPLFALKQEKNALVFTMAAAKPVRVTLAKLDSTKPFHLIVTASEKEIVFYRNGKKTGAHPGLAGDFSTWKNGRLYFGNDEKGTCPWRGRIEKFALYNQALGAAQAGKVASAALKEIADRQPPARVELVGTLLKRSKYRMPWGENTYRDGLAECEYRVKKVIRGEYKEKKIRVAELMFVNRIFLTNSRRKVGGEYRLVVEELDGNLRMSKVERGLLEPDFDLVVHVEVGPFKALPKGQQPKPKKEK